MRLYLRIFWVPACPAILRDPHQPFQARVNYHVAHRVAKRKHYEPENSRHQIGSNLHRRPNAATANKNHNYLAACACANPNKPLFRLKNGSLLSRHTFAAETRRLLKDRLVSRSDTQIWDRCRHYCRRRSRPRPFKPFSVQMAR